MASESSSAVLELNDADTEDTEATVTDDVREGTPLIMEHGYDIAVKVDAPMKQLSTLETFVTYRVRCVCARWSTPTHVRRRYNHFKLLHKRLTSSYPLLAPPPVPPLHSARQQLDRYDPAFVALRTHGLDAFLDRIAKHPILTYSEDFRIFVTTPDDELDKVFKSDSGAHNLWGLSSLYSSSDTKPANGPRVKDPEFTSATEYLTSLEHKLTTLCSLTTRLHKGTGALAKEYKSMQRACDVWSGSGAGAGAGGCAGAAGVSRGAGGAARAHCAPAPRAPTPARAPMLAAYAHAIVQKIAQRDQIHAAYVSGGNTTDELHNRLSQASEALRSDLADWLPKTHSDIKTLLLQLADRQVNLHTQTLYSWEQAHKLATEQNIDQIFKTVSKTAVQNLSPSRCRSEMTERDLEDCSDYSDVCGNDESFSKGEDGFSKVDESFSKVDDEVEDNFSKFADGSSKDEDNFSKVNESFSKVDESFSNANKTEVFSDTNTNHTTEYDETGSVKDSENYQKIDVNGKMTDLVSNSKSLDISNIDENIGNNGIISDDSVNDVFNSIVDDLNLQSNNDSNVDVSNKIENDNNLNSDGTPSEIKSTKTSAVLANTDPLSSFCDVDLS